MGTFYLEATPNIAWEVAATFAPVERCAAPPGTRIPMLVVLPKTLLATSREKVLDAARAAGAKEGDERDWRTTLTALARPLVPVVQGRAFDATREARAERRAAIAAEEGQKKPNEPGDVIPPEYRAVPLPQAASFDLVEIMGSSTAFVQKTVSAVQGGDEDQRLRTLRRIRCLHPWMLLLPEIGQALRSLFDLPQDQPPLVVARRFLADPAMHEKSSVLGGRPPGTSIEPSALFSIHEELTSLRPQGTRRSAVQVIGDFVIGEHGPMDESRRQAYNAVYADRKRLVEMDVVPAALLFPGEALAPGQAAATTVDGVGLGQERCGLEEGATRRHAYWNALLEWALTRETQERVEIISAGALAGRVSVLEGVVIAPLSSVDIALSLYLALATRYYQDADRRVLVCKFDQFRDLLRAGHPEEDPGFNAVRKLKLPELLAARGFDPTSSPPTSRSLEAIAATVEEPVARWLHWIAALGDEVEHRLPGWRE